MTNEERIKKHLKKSNVAFLSNFQGTDFEIRMFVEDITDQHCHPHTDVEMDGVAFTEGSRDAADPAGSSHRARPASEAEPALRCEASARGVRRQSNNL